MQQDNPANFTTFLFAFEEKMGAELRSISHRLDGMDAELRSISHRLDGAAVLDAPPTTPVTSPPGIPAHAGAAGTREERLLASLLACRPGISIDTGGTTAAASHARPAQPLVEDERPQGAPCFEHAGATQSEAVSALTAAAALGDAVSAIATQEALAAHPAHGALSLVDPGRGPEPCERAGQAGVVVAARLARRLGLALSEQLGREAGWEEQNLQHLDDAQRHLLQTPLTVFAFAKAYDCVREVRQSCSPTCEDTSKWVALAVREVLILQICISTAGSLLTEIGFEAALGTAFARPLGPKLRSQLHLAHNTICRLGRDRADFDRKAPKMFNCSGLLTTEEWLALFSTYHQSWHASRGWLKASPTSSSRRERKEGRGKKREAALVDALPQEPDFEEEMDVEEEQWLSESLELGTLGEALRRRESRRRSALPHVGFEAEELQWLESDQRNNLPSTSSDSEEASFAMDRDARRAVRLRCHEKLRAQRLIIESTSLP
jgi:hypothetical protein